MRCRSVFFKDRQKSIRKYVIQKIKRGCKKQHRKKDCEQIRKRIGKQSFLWYNVDMKKQQIMLTNSVGQIGKYYVLNINY